MQNSENRQHTETDDHKSKKSSSTFVARSLGYEKRFSKTANLKELENGLKEEYCNAVKEIKKVDQGIVPGTNIPFKEATYIQVDDAYKEYFQKIAQIRQIFFDTASFTIPPNEEEYEIEDINLQLKYLKKRSEVFEDHIKCKYKDTKWNMDNYRYSPSIFDSSKIYDYFE